MIRYHNVDSINGLGPVLIQVSGRLLVLIIERSGANSSSDQSLLGKDLAQSLNELEIIGSIMGITIGNVISIHISFE